MRVNVLYGSDPTFIDIPDSRFMGVFGVKGPLGIDEDMVIENSLNNPIGKRLEDYDVKSVLISVNDHIRLTPTLKLLDHILKRVSAKRLKIIVATGSHRAPTEEEYHSMILGHYYDRLRGVTLAHDCRKSEFIYLGVTSSGTPILINREVLQHDLIITISSVELHYFAGYSGGRKMIALGLCMYETIEKNHKLALMPEAALGRFKGNPVHEDLEEIARAVAKRVNVFSLNIAINGDLGF